MLNIALTVSFTLKDFWCIHYELDSTAHDFMFALPNQ